MCSWLKFSFRQSFARTPPSLAPGLKEMVALFSSWGILPEVTNHTQIEPCLLNIYNVLGALWQVLCC